MYKNCFQSNPDADYPDFDNPSKGLLEGTNFPVRDDKGDVEKVWGKKIPTDYFPVGGDMLYGWIKVCRDERDPEGVFRGEYMDIMKRYMGKFKYVHPKGKKIPEDIYRGYHISSFPTAEKVVVNANSNSPFPTDYFYLQVIEPENIEYANY